MGRHLLCERRNLTMLRFSGVLNAECIRVKPGMEGGREGMWWILCHTPWGSISQMPPASWKRIIIQTTYYALLDLPLLTKGNVIFKFNTHTHMSVLNKEHKKYLCENTLVWSDPPLQKKVKGWWGYAVVSTSVFMMLCRHVSHHSRRAQVLGDKTPHTPCKGRVCSGRRKEQWQHGWACSLTCSSLA